ncbi:hypothetical protein ACHWQZ_G015151 [Mnemiopsis leidyi]
MLSSLTDSLGTHHVQAIPSNLNCSTLPKIKVLENNKNYGGAGGSTKHSTRSYLVLPSISCRIAGGIKKKSKSNRTGSSEKSRKLERSKTVERSKTPKISKTVERSNTIERSKTVDDVEEAAGQRRSRIGTSRCPSRARSTSRSGKQENPEYPLETIELSNTIKRALASWSILTILLSILGNTVVLIASLKHNSIKFDKVSVILIENIAAADLGDVVFVVLPTTAAILSDQADVSEFFSANKFGQTVCFSVAHLQFLFPTASIVMVCALSVSKLFCLMFPLQSYSRSPTVRRIIAFVAWTVYLPRFLVTVLDHDKALYGYYEEGFRCYIDNWTRWLTLVDTVMAFLTVILPWLILVSTVCVLLYYVHKIAGLQRKVVLVNILISFIFAVSVAPYIARQIWMATSPNSHPVRTWLWLSALFINYISCFSNPIILYLTSASFKSFVDTRCSSAIASVKNICPRFRRLHVAGAQDPLLREPEPEC